MACIVMAYTGMTYMVMAYAVVASIIMAYAVVAYTVTAYMGVSDIVMNVTNLWRAPGHSVCMPHACLHTQSLIHA